MSLVYTGVLILVFAFVIYASYNAGYHKGYDTGFVDGRLRGAKREKGPGR